ncbi:MAG: long-chain fatty acid--CoA ligase [Ktedonobacteraceae bacterium]
MTDSLSTNNTDTEPDILDQSFLGDERNEGDKAFAHAHPWLQHYEQGVPVSITVPNYPLTWLLDYTVQRYPHHTAFIYYGTKITYARFSQLADRFAGALQQLGVKKGDRVAIALPNIPQYPIAFYGTLLAGAIVVQTNPLYTEREMQYQLADAGARVLVMLDSFYPTVHAIRAHTALEQVIVTSPADFLPPMLHAFYPLSQRLAGQPGTHMHRELHKDPTLHVMSALLKAHTYDEAAPVYRPVELSAEDIAVLQYTGGTTGLSKGAMLTHRNLLANTLQTRFWFTKIRDGEEVMLAVAPFFHSYGLTACLNVSILLAATIVLLPRFKSKDVLKAISHYHPTLFPGIPTMYQAIIHEASRHPNDLKSIKYCISGAAPLPSKVRTNFEAITHGKLVEGYGLSEAAPVTHCNPLTNECRDGSIGLPLPSVDAAIMDPETGVPVPVGKLGEIVVKGPNVMLGYWKREEETRAMFRHGWMRTGDLGRMDADGFFSVVERIKDVIIASGFKIFPHEVEEVLLQHPYISEAAVAGVPDEYRGETVAAFIVLKPEVEDSAKTRQELINYCQHVLTAYKVPKIVEFRESLPKSLIGKVLRRELHIT